MFPRRYIEKIAAFGIAFALVVSALWKNTAVSSPVATGLLFGVFVPAFVFMIGLSAAMEGWALTGILVFVGFGYGFGAAGGALFGYVVFAIALVITLSVGNRLRRSFQ